MTVEDLIKEAKETLRISGLAANKYREKAQDMLLFVNKVLSSREDIFQLLGGNPLQLMYDKQKHHVQVMSTILMYSLYDLLVREFLWNYRIYLNHGFSEDYFSLELKTWIMAISKHISVTYRTELTKVYEWLLTKQTEMIRLSKEVKMFSIDIRDEWREYKSKFLTAILTGDDEKAWRLAKDFIDLSGDIATFYVEVVQPIMYEIGCLWESGKISIPEEHLATSIVSKVLCNLYEEIEIKRRDKPKIRYKAVVTAAPNEYHEMGARMIADLLENEGWKVYYLGTNVSEERVISMVKKTKPELLCISATMTYNLERVKNIIENVKKLKKPPKVLVGGLAFNINPDLYIKLGADFWARDVRQALEIIRNIEVRIKHENKRNIQKTC